MTLTLEAGAAAKAKAHTVYRTADGTRVPGVTTILGVLAKPGLVPWANKLGLQGIEVDKYRDALAEVGTLAHALIHEHLTGVSVDLTHYSPARVAAATHSLGRFLGWLKGKAVKTILAEAPLVSEQHRFGGTIDWYGTIDGVPTLVDFKTAKAIYDEHVLQVAAYRVLLVEAGYPVEAVRILQVGRTEEEGFSERMVSDTSAHVELFTHCLAIYRLQAVIRGGARR